MTMSIAVLVLILLVVLLLIVQRVQRRRWQAQRAREAMVHGQHLAGKLAEHDQQVMALRAGQAASDAMRDRALHLAARGMRWELNSRESLVKACEAASLDAVIATNVVFAVSSPKQTFCAQLDHVVLTDNMMLVVDSKYWNGLVFDGTRPSELATPFGAVIDEQQLVAPFAVQLRPRDDAAIGIRIDAGASAPARQVRVGASRLHTYLAPLAGNLPFIDTCVFYSHPSATVVTPGVDVQGKARTLIADVYTIDRMLRRAHTSRPSSAASPNLERITAALTELGADIIRTGRFAVDQPQSPVALDYRVRTRRERSAMRGRSGETAATTSADSHVPVT